MSIALDTLLSRRSVRSFDGRPLDAEDRDALEAVLAETGPGPFGAAPRVRLLDAAQAGLEDADRAPARIGAYGVVSGARAWLVGAIENGPDACVDFGYAFEGIVLAAAERGVGTCWLGGTFSRGAAARAIGLAEGELLPAISPVGYPADRRTLVDAAFRLGAGSDGRKPWRELFFDGEPGRPLPASGLGDWAGILEAVRRAPSASNRQPWRLVRDAPGRIRLLFAENRAYNRALEPVRVQELDLGIAMRHLAEACAATGRTGAWARLSEDAAKPAAPFAYHATWLGDA